MSVVAKTLNGNTIVYIISDEVIRSLYAEKIRCSFLELQIPCQLISPPKCDTKEVIDRMVDESLTPFVILMGGSSSFSGGHKNCAGMAIVPTTIRSFVNFKEFQESIPIESRNTKMVFIDPSILVTLPHRHFLSGVSEFIKIAVVFSSGWKSWVENVSESESVTFDDGNEFFDYVESKAHLFISGSETIVSEMVSRTLETKTRIQNLAVKQNDPRVLCVLKLGECIGRAIRILSPEMFHGECLAIGIVKEAQIYGGNVLSTYTIGRLIRCLKRFQLPTRVPHNLKTMEVIEKLEKIPKNAALESIQFALEKQVSIVPGTKVSGCIRVPGSKSISNRVLLMAAMGEGTCRVSGLLLSDDTQVMINALERIGMAFQWTDDNQVLVVHGKGGKFCLADSAENEIFVNHSGTSARFLTSFLTLVNAKESIHLTGSERLQERPIGPLVDSLRMNGCSINYLGNEGCLPLSIDHTGLKGGLIRLSAKISSTFVTSLLIAAPYASEPLTIELEEDEPTSLPYILMTIQLMAKFNIHVEMHGVNRYIVPCGVYQNPSNFDVEVDASSATYPLGIIAFIMNIM